MNSYPLNSYSCSHILLDFIIAIVQLAETGIDIYYFFKMSFEYHIFFYLTFGFLCLNLITQFIYASIRLCLHKVSFKLYVSFKNVGLFSEKMKITDCGYFSKITAHTSDLTLVLLYFFAPIVLVFLLVSLVLNLVYVILNWFISIIMYVLLTIIMTFVSTIYCTLKLDLLLYSGCCRVVAFFYFISSKNAQSTNEKMLSSKKICILLQVLFESIPLLTIFVINGIKMGFFKQDNLSNMIIAWLNVGLASCSIFFSCLQIITLTKYVKIAESPYKEILRISTNQNFSKKETEIINGQSLDVLPMNHVVPITYKIEKLR